MIFKNLDGTTRPTFLVGNGLTTTQRLALTNKKPGQFVYDTTTLSFWWWDGTNWNQFGNSSTSGRSPYTFFGTGYYRTATGIDVQRVSPGFTSTAIVFKRAIAGTTGTTEIDVLVNGVSMFLPANRPKILASAGNDATTVVIPDSPIILNNATVQMSIVGVESGDPQDVTVQIF